MNKFCKLLISVLFFSVFFMGCESTSVQPKDFHIDIQYESENSPVTLAIEPVWGSTFLSGSGFKGFICNFKNNTEKTVRVVWDQSSINYNGSSYVPFIEGQKYINAQDPMSPMAIPKNGTSSKQVYSSNQPHFTSGRYGGWSMNPIVASKVELLFCIKTDSGEEFITVVIDTIN